MSKVTHCASADTSGLNTSVFAFPPAGPVERRVTHTSDPRGETLALMPRSVMATSDVDSLRRPDSLSAS